MDQVVHMHKCKITDISSLLKLMGFSSQKSDNIVRSAVILFYSSNGLVKTTRLFLSNHHSS